jgi:hypothetical protein
MRFGRHLGTVFPGSRQVLDRAVLMSKRQVFSVPILSFSAPKKLLYDAPRIRCRIIPEKDVIEKPRFRPKKVPPGDDPHNFTILLDRQSGASFLSEKTGRLPHGGCRRDGHHRKGHEVCNLHPFFPSPFTRSLIHCTGSCCVQDFMMADPAFGWPPPPSLLMMVPMSRVSG